MDLTITITDGKISTTLYEKPMALHQYIPPSSAHPPGMARGLVIGQTLRYHQLCSIESDAQLRMKKLYKRLLARGYSRDKLIPLFTKGLTKAREFLELPLEARLQATCAKALRHDRVFLKLPYHPNDPSSATIQALWHSIVLEPEERQPLYDIRNHNNEPIGVNRMIVAYSRNKNIGNLLSLRRYDRLQGPKVSSYGFHNQGPNL